APFEGAARLSRSIEEVAATRIVVVATLALVVAAAVSGGAAGARIPIAQCTSSVGPGIPPPRDPPSGLDGFHAAWYGQSGYPTLCPGDRASPVVAYYNSGSLGWVSGRMGEV